MKVLRFLAACVVALVGLASQANASILTLNYDVTPQGPSSYLYEFELILDNTDGTWKPGESFNWIIFGDVLSGSSPLEDFVVLSDTLPDTFRYSISGGEHNGPTFLNDTPPDYTGWVPEFAGDSVTWTGVSSSLVDTLFFSIHWDENQHFVTYRQANIPGDPEPEIRGEVPEPASMAIFGLSGLGMLAAARRRKSKQVS